MPTSDSSWSASLRVIGDLERQDHSFLTDTDDCAYFGDYTARAGFGHSSANSTISNLKKKPSLRGTGQWHYKLKAIREIGEAIAANIDPAQIAQITFVPIPPSKRPEDPDYDDRMLQVARAIGPSLDVRDLLFTATTRDAAHSSSASRDPIALRASMGIRVELLVPAATKVILLDDVLTTGCSFKVCSEIIRESWPQAEIFGLFVARRAIDHASLFDSLDLP